MIKYLLVLFVSLLAGINFPDLDLAYYELRYQDTTGNPQWQNSVPLVDILKT